MSRMKCILTGSLVGAILGFFAGPAIAYLGRSGCVVDVPSGSLYGMLIGQYLGRLAGRSLHGKRLTIGRCLGFLACFALYLSAVARYWR